MHQTKLVRLLSVLDAAELKSFQKFLHSPYHNSNRQLPPLLDCLAPYHPAFDHKNLAKETVYQRIHPEGKAYHEGRMNLLMSQLAALLKQFLAFEQLKKDEFQQRKFRLKAYREKRLDNEYSKEVEKQEAALTAWREDASYHLEKFLLNREVFFHQATPHYQVGMPSLDASLEHLDLFFVWEKLWLAAIAFNRMQVFNENIPIHLLDSVLQQFKLDIENTVELSIYQKIIHAQTTNEEQPLRDITSAFINGAEIFPDEVKSEILIFLNNLISQKIRQGKTQFYKDAFTLTKFRISHIIDKHGQTLSDVAFTNIASIGSVVHEFEWTEWFIDKYKDRLKEKVRNDAIQLAYAILYYEKAIETKLAVNFITAINFMLKIGTKNPFYYYRIKLLNLRIHYEYYLLKKEDGYDFLTDYANAFEKQLARENAMGKLKKSAFMNFVKSLKKIINSASDPNFNASKKEMLFELVNKYENISAKQWLLEKIRELKTVP